MTVDTTKEEIVAGGGGGSQPVVIRVEDLAKSFPSPHGELRVLDGVDFEVGRGEYVAVTGVSGSGKSTLLHLMGALDRPDRGRVVFDEVDLFALSSDEQAAFRNREIGFVFQFHHLLPEFSAVENVMMPALISGEGHQRARSRAMELLDVVKLTERAGHRPGELSGGEQQRVAVARALVNSPRVVLADEPTGSLDPGTAEELYQLLLRLRAELGQTLVVVTHEPDLAALADRAYSLRNGKAHADGVRGGSGGV